MRTWAHLAAGFLALGVLIAGVCIWHAFAFHQDIRPPSDVQTGQTGLFSLDPQDISNRLYRQIHVRTAKNGKEYGLDELDPLLWSQTKYLRSGPSHTQVLRLLDEFSRSPANRQPRDPVKKAILARELWAVFDWAASSTGDQNSEKQDRSRRELDSGLAPVIHQLALTQTEIAALPDNFQRAIQNKEFPADYDPAHPERPFLPPEMFNPRGPWVCIGINGEARIAPIHEKTFSRSAFFVFMHLPGGRQAALAYLKQIEESIASQKLPMGAEFALVRQLILPDDHGNLVLAPVIESVQIRHYREVAPDESAAHPHESDFEARFQSVYEFKLDRAGLFTAEHSGLRAVNSTEEGFILFMSHGFDPFENLEPEEKYKPVLSFCRMCHSSPLIHSVLSFTLRWDPVTKQAGNPHLAETTPAAEAAKVIAWKQTQDNWKLVLQLWNPGSAQAAR